jgi:PAS domain-containing protein
MKSVCAWCKKEMGTVHSDYCAESVITHGICEACANIVFEKLNMDRAVIFLDRLAEPVLVVDGDLVALAANSRATEVLGKDLPHIKGFRGGDIINCVHADEPGGCGRTIHCTGCTIRNTVEDTYKTGRSHLRVRAYADIPIEGRPQRVGYLISTEKIKGVVLLRIDKAGDSEEAGRQEA